MFSGMDVAANALVSYYKHYYKKRGFLQVLVTGIVTNREQKIPSQITGKIMFKPTGHFYSCGLFTGNL